MLTYDCDGRAIFHLLRPSVSRLRRELFKRPAARRKTSSPRRLPGEALQQDRRASPIGISRHGCGLYLEPAKIEVSGLAGPGKGRCGKIVELRR
jgi:hypothetical protein